MLNYHKWHSQILHVSVKILFQRAECCISGWDIVRGMFDKVEQMLKCSG